MEKYKKEMQQKMSLLIAFNGIMTMILVWESSMSDKLPDSNFLSFSNGFKSGSAICLMIIALVYVVKYSKCMKDDSKLKQNYIADTDERIQEINKYAGGYFIKLVLGIIYIITYVSSYFSQTVFLTLLAVLLLISILRLVTFKVYERKLS